jgi:Mrp family chromosome partitioning ATPase
VLGILGGAILGAIVAQSLARRSRGFHARSEPQSILQTGLIADVPVFGNEKLTTSLPTTEAPQSAAAEAFRFVATGIELRQHSATDNPFKSVVVASATLADGKTTVTANTAFAAARSGRRIALVDADFVNPALTRMLVPDGTDGPGLTDVVAGETSLAEVGIDITGAPGGSITLFRRGTHGTRIPEFFASTQAANLIHEIEQEYDLVLIDAPPLLRLAHSGTVVRLADRVMIVVAHRSDISVAEELQRYLSIVGVPVLGYVYNFAPLRREMLGRSGSNGRDETAA